MQSKNTNLKYISLSISFFIPCGIFLILLAYKGIFPFGSRTLFLNSLTEQPFSVFYRFHSQLHNGSFSLLNAAGIYDLNMAEAFPFYLSSPFTLLASLIPGTNAFKILSILNILRIGLAGVSMCFYLMYYQKKKATPTTSFESVFSPALFSCAYALGSCFILQQSDYRYIDFSFLFPLFMISLQNLLKENKKLLFYITLSVMFLDNAPLAISVIFILFVIIFLSDKEDLLPYSLIRFTYNSLICFIIASITTIPAILTIFRHGAPYKRWPDFSFLTDWFTFFTRFLPCNDASVRFLSHAGTNTYFSLFLLLFTILSFFSSSSSFRKIIGRFLSCIFMLFVLNTSTFTHIFSPATFEQELLCNYDFLIVFFGINLAFKIKDELNDIKPIFYILALLIPVILTLLSGLYATHPVSTADLLPVIILLTCYLTILILYRVGSIKKGAFLLIGFFLMICELFIHTEHLIYNLSKEQTDLSSFLSALDRRVEITYDPFTIENVAFHDSLPFNRNILPESYILSGYYTPPVQQPFDFDTVNAIYNSLGGDGRMFDETNLQVVTEPESQLINCKSYSDNTMIYESRDYPEEYYQSVFHFLPDKSGPMFFSMDTITYIGEAIANEPLTLNVYLPKMSYFANVMHVKTAYFNASGYTDLARSIKESTPNLYRNFFTISTDIDCVENSTLVLPINKKFKTITHVDGQKTDIINAPANKLGILLQAGHHHIEIALPILFLLIPCLLSLCSIALLLIINFMPSYALNYSKSICKKSSRAFLSILDSLHKQLYANRLLLLSFFIPFVVLLTACIAASFSPFGESVYFKHDGAALTLPNQYFLRALMQNGNPDYSELSGGGINAYYYNPAPLSNLWLLLFPSGSLIIPATLLSIIRTSFCAPALYIYLTNRLTGIRAKKTDNRILIFTTAYALSSYTLNFRHFINWPYMVAALPLLILCLDYLMLRNRSSLYTLLLACCMIFNVMHAIYLCAFLFFWFFSYHFANISDFLRKGIRFALSSILSAGMAFWILSMNLISRKSLGYNSYDSIAPNPYEFYQNYFNSLKQLFLFSDPVSITDNDGAINLYCSVLIIPLILLFIFLVNRNKRYWFRLGLALFIFFSSNNDLLSYIWNGLHYQSKVPNRYSFLLIFLLLDMGYEGLIVLRKAKPKTVFSLSITSLVFSGMIVFFARKEITASSSITSLSLLVLYSILLFAVQKSYVKKRYMVYYALIGITVFELALNNIAIFRGEQYGDGTYIDQNIAVTNFLNKNWLNNDKTIRTSYLSNEFTNQHLVNNISSINQFSSLTTATQTSMAASYGCYSSPNNISIMTNETPFTNAMLNIGYMIVSPIVPDQFLDLEHYELIGRYVDNLIYKNTRCLSLGFYIPQNLKELTTNSSISSELSNSFAKAFDVSSPIFSAPIQLTMNSIEHTDKPASSIPANSCTISLLDSEAALSYLATIKIVPPENGEYYYRNSEFYYLGNLNKNEEYTFTIPIHTDADAGLIVRYNDAAFQAFYEKASANPLKIQKYENGNMEGTISCPENGYLLLSIPYETGWKAFVDGRETVIEHLINGAIIIPVESGKHTISMHFASPGKWLSYMVTIPFWIIWILLTLIEYDMFKICSKFTEKKNKLSI